MEPVVLALKQKYEGRAVFIVADTATSDGSALAAKFNIYYIPAFFIIDSAGKVIFDDVGVQSAKKLDDILAKAVGTE